MNRYLVSAAIAAAVVTAPLAARADGVADIAEPSVATAWSCAGTDAHPAAKLTITIEDIDAGDLDWFVGLGGDEPATGTVDGGHTSKIAFVVPQSGDIWRWPSGADGAGSVCPTIGEPGDSEDSPFTWAYDTSHEECFTASTGCSPYLHITLKYDGSEYTDGSSDQYQYRGFDDLWIVPPKSSLPATATTSASGQPETTAAAEQPATDAASTDQAGMPTGAASSSTDAAPDLSTADEQLADSGQQPVLAHIATRSRGSSFLGYLIVLGLIAVGRWNAIGRPRPGSMSA